MANQIRDASTERKRERETRSVRQIARSDERNVGVTRLNRMPSIDLHSLPRALLCPAGDSSRCRGPDHENEKEDDEPSYRRICENTYYSSILRSASAAGQGFSRITRGVILAGRSLLCANTDETGTFGAAERERVAEEARTSETTRLSTARSRGLTIKSSSRREKSDRA